MTILELEQRTQLERATIRYYEREGLIAPARKENSYRDYSEEDLNEIMKIKLLRQLDLSIDTIKQLQQGSLSIHDALQAQAYTLEQQIARAQRAAQICKEISDEAVTYNDIDAVHYLDKLQQAAEEDTESETKPHSESQDAYREYHPVRRFISRFVDYYLVEVLVRFLLCVVLRIRPFSELLSHIVKYGCLLLNVPLQAIMLHLFGTTPGKRLMGIRVMSYNGKKLDFENAILREWQALLYGYGLGIPWVRLWRLYSSYKDYRDSKKIEQDIGVEHIYSYWNIFWNVKRKSVFAAFCAIIMALNLVNACDCMKPKYRGTDISIAEFAENYNFYAKSFKNTFKMNPDGTWYTSDSQTEGNTVVITLSKPQKINEPFRFETEGERISRITYQNTWENVSFFEPISSKLITACLTVAGTQRGIAINEMISILKLIDENKADQSVRLQYENIEIHWEIKSVNCHNVNGRYISKDNQPSSLTLDFEIIIHE